MFRKLLGRDDAHEFRPTIAEIEERPAHPLGRIVFWVIIAVMIFFAIWMYAGKVDVVVSARGTIIPEGEIKVLQPLDAGVLSGILCKEGDFVRQGQVLVEIDPSITAPEVDSKRKSLQYLELEKSRLDSTLRQKGFEPNARAHDPASVKTQRELYESARANLAKQLEAKKAELNRVEAEIKSAEKEKVYNRALLDVAVDRERRLRVVTDIVAKSEYEKAVNDVLTHSNAIEQLTHKLEGLTHQKSQALNELDVINESFKVTTLREFSDKEKQATELRAELDKTSFKNQKQRIASPVDGYVTNLFVHTVGGVVTPAQKLVAVVPVSAPLVIKAIVLNKDIGFVQEGMAASIKIDTFDFQKYGVLAGTVRNVSKHSIEDEKLGPVYEVYIVPGATSLIVDGTKISISSGMSVTAEIKTGKRRIIEFFVYPIIKYLDEGIKVR